MTRDLTPTGKLRLGINGANPTLYVPAADGSASGISAELGAFIAGKLGVPLEPLVYTGPGAFPASFGTGEWDVIVTGKNPHAANFVDFVSDVVLIDYVYLAGPRCRIDTPADVDRVGVKIGVPEGASAHAFLSRRLKSAEVVTLRASAEDVMAMLRGGEIDLYASGIGGLQEIADRLPGSRIIGQFETVVFALSTNKGLSAETRTRLAEIVGEAKAAGLVQSAIDRYGQKGARAAPVALAAS
jgi:polar amino acid transport system substrate-binding protein